MMITLNQIIRSRIGFAVAAAALMLNLSLAHAVPFNPNVVITGSNDFDQDNSFNGTGGFSMVSGGATTSSTYDGAPVVTGADPLAGSLTDIGDGFGFTGTASVTDDDFLIGFDIAINAINNTSIMQTIVFKLSFSNMVNADGDDAYAHSNLSLSDDIIGDDFFFSDLKSDTVFGDENGGVLIDPDPINNPNPANYGATLTESGDLLFSYIMDPLDEVNLFMSWTLEGGDYAGGLAEGDLTAFLSVDAVVPLPGSLWLMLSGMLLLLQRVVRR